MFWKLKGVTVQLVQAKCQEAPLNSSTISWLYLLAITIGDHLVQFVTVALSWKQERSWLGFYEMKSGLFLLKTESLKS